MGRSGRTSCFRIMTCSTDLFEDDGRDFEIRKENVSSSDKRSGASHKKSRKHKGRGNTGIALAIEKEDTETNHSTSRSHSEPYTPEKSASDNEKCETHAPSPLPSAINLLSEESAIILIQTAVRGFLAQRQSQRLKNVVKLQAAMRGRLVRRQAVATLKCVQAVVKMQALVRARLLQSDAENPAELDPTDQKDTKRSKSLRKGSYKLDKQNSIVSLLKNGFAQLLLESTPTPKPVYISCDHSKSESAWKWLERWMAASSESEGEQHEKFGGDYDGRTESLTSPTKIFDGKKKPELDNNNDDEACSELNIFSYPGAHASNEIAMQSSSEASQSSSDNEKHNSGEEKPKGTTAVVEPVETRDKKTSNPSFTAAKSLFEGLTSPTSGRLSKFHFRSTSMTISDILPIQPDSSESGDLLKRCNPNNDNNECDRGKHGHSSSLSAIEALQQHSTYDGADKFGEQLLAIPETAHSDTDLLEDASDHQVKGPPPPEYMRASMAMTELQGTPSSPPSITTRTDKGLSMKKQKHNVTKKKPLSIRRCVDDSKKEKDSLGLDKSHHIDHGPRISKNGPRPSYMQATESAKAKIHAMNSPKEDADLPYRDNHTKKKHAPPVGMRGPVSSSRSKPTISSSLQQSSRDKVSSQLC